jgi:hypothetical protein
MADKNKKSGESLQFLTFNFSPNAKRITKNGIDYLECPAVMMPTQCVMNGVLYLKDASESSVLAWNGKPLLVYHSEKDGKPISANNPNTYFEQTIGNIFETRVEDNKLKVNCLIDISKANSTKDGARVLAAIESNKEIDVSTSMMIHGYVENGIYGGKEYFNVAASFDPDHLAILLDQKGASSWEDGSGFMRNSDEEENARNKELNHNKELPTMERQEKVSALIKSGVIATNQREAFEKMSNGDFGSFESFAKQNSDNAEIIALLH